MLLHFALVLHFAVILITFCVNITFCGDYYILRRNTSRSDFVGHARGHVAALTPKANWFDTLTVKQ